MMTAHPILPEQHLTTAEDPEFLRRVEEGTKVYYQKIGVNPPWIGYLFRNGDEWIGTGGFKGSPSNGRVEIAYAVRPEQEGKGLGTAICAQLIVIAQSENPTIRIVARTLPQENASTRILARNGFQFQGMVQDDEDGEVWEWQYLP